MKNKKIVKVLVLLVLLITLTGCTHMLKGKDGKPVRNEETGQTITENIICKPTDKKTIKIYKENNVDIEKLPDCNNIKISGKYENLWNSLFVRPLAFAIIKVGEFVKSNAISIVIITLIIRLLLYSNTKKTLLQSENMKKAQPEIKRIEKKYEGKNDNESIQKKGQEMMMVYKKYNIKPLSGCLFAFIQLPILFAFYEAIQRVPAIFEENFLGINMGTTPGTAISNGNWLYIVICIILIIITFLSFKTNPSMNNTKDKKNDKTKDKEKEDEIDPTAMQQKMMGPMMTVFIGFMSFTLPTAIALYWITSSLFTIFQNLTMKRGKKA
ncbi:MAG: YidC/Oxa1 family membrane protein insertase [Bacilli bacterium]|nr:YidC/Oxa1 family membrane protein insertase [Bacilli bacterium]